MLLQNEIDVALGLEATWDLLTDLERIAPCLPEPPSTVATVTDTGAA